MLMEIVGVLCFFLLGGILGAVLMVKAPSPRVSVLAYTAKQGDTLFLIPLKPILPDQRKALLDSLRTVPTLQGVECVVLPSDFRVEAKA